jgi:hypothetical protein
MTYVGATPTTGDFKLLDSITTSSSTTFNLRQGGVAVYPQSANHCLVVLNGVLQTAGSSFNIVNDTIVFASSLASSDVINQILVLGNVNDIGVPSDDTVSTAKLQSSAVTDAKISAMASSKLTGTVSQSQIADQAINEAKLQISNAPTNGYMLTAQSGNTGGLTWAEAGGGTLELISTHSQTSGVSSITMNNLFSTTYNVYRVFIRYLRPQTNDTEVRMQMLDTSGVRTNTAYRYAVLRIRDGGEDNYHNSGNTSFLLNAGTYNSEQQGGANFDMTIRTFRSATGDQYTFNMDYRSATARNNNQASTFIGSGHYNEKNSDHPANGLKFFMDSGNIDRVFISVYGVKGAV